MVLINIIIINVCPKLKTALLPCLDTLLTDVASLFCVLNVFKNLYINSL